MFAYNAFKCCFYLIIVCGRKFVVSSNGVRITTLEQNLPFVSISVIDGKTIYSGALMEMINKIGEILNITYEIVPPVDNAYGAIINGRWNGLIGMVLRGETDIVASLMTITKQRQQVVDYSTFFNVDNLGILIRFSDSNGSLMRLAEVFSLLVWTIFLSLVIVAMFMIYILQKFAIISGDRGAETFARSAWYVFSAQMNQEANRVVKSLSGRTFEIIWRLGSFLVVSIYCGSLYAVLTTNKTRLPFENLDGLVNKLMLNEYKVCIVSATSFWSFIQDVNDSSSIGKLNRWFTMNRKYERQSFAECLNLFFAEDNVAIISARVALRETQASMSCRGKLILLDFNIFPTFDGIAFAKNSSLVKPFSNCIEQMWENGVLLYWIRKYSTKARCHIALPNDAATTESTPLSLINFCGVFIILALGIVVAVFAFLFERWKSKLVRTLIISFYV